MGDMGVNETSSQPRNWTGAEKTLIWFGFLLPIVVGYLWRVQYLLVHPEVEPYFSRPALVVVSGLLLVMAVATLALVGVALWARRRSPENPWLLHAGNQLWWIFISLCAYAIGPMTTPILGLLVIGGFLAAQLFDRQYLFPAIGSGLTVLVVTTALERMGQISYAPLFVDLPGGRSELSTSYIVGTGVVALVLIVACFASVSYVVERDRARERTLEVTDRRRQKAQAELEDAIASLRETEQRFRQLAENGRDVFWLVEIESGRLLYLSPHFEEMLGLRVAEVSEDPAMYLRIVHPDDLERMSAAFADRLRPTGPHDGVMEFRITHPASGEVKWLRARGFPIPGDDGAVIRIGGLIEDITQEMAAAEALRAAHDDLERKVEERTAALSLTNIRLREEAEQRQRAEHALLDRERLLREQFTELEHLYQNAPVGLCLLDSEMRYVRINERLAEINGRPAEDHIGRTVAQVLPEIAAGVGELVQRAYESDEPLEVEFRGTVPGFPGEERTWLTTYAAVRSSDGSALGMTTVLQDITELKRAEEAAREHLKELAHVSRVGTMGEMATGLAHQLNQPLAAITNYAYALRRQLEGRNGIAGGEVDPKVRSILDELEDRSLNAADIVKRLRAFINKEPPRRDRASVNRLLGDVVGLMDAEFRSYRVRPTLELDKADPVAEVDAVQIQQVVLNLARNALDAMQGLAVDERRLEISSVFVDGVATVAVADNGPGVEPDAIDRIFEAFHTTKPDGMGMGLAIGRSIIEAHGGRLWAEPNRDRGMTFRFTLPVTGEEA